MLSFSPDAIKQKLLIIRFVDLTKDEKNGVFMFRLHEYSIILIQLKEFDCFPLICYKKIHIDFIKHKKNRIAFETSF